MVWSGRVRISFTATFFVPNEWRDIGSFPLWPGHHIVTEHMIDQRIRRRILRQQLHIMPGAGHFVLFADSLVKRHAITG